MKYYVGCFKDDLECGFNLWGFDDGYYYLLAILYYGNEALENRWEVYGMDTDYSVPEDEIEDEVCSELVSIPTAFALDLIEEYEADVVFDKVRDLF